LRSDTTNPLPLHFFSSQRPLRSRRTLRYLFFFESPIPRHSQNPLQFSRASYAPHHPIPPRSRNLPLAPRSPQNLPLPPPKTPSRLRQHPHRPNRIDLPLERKNRNRPRTSPPDQDHRASPKIRRKGSPPPPLLQNPRIPGPPRLLRLPRLPPLALRLLQKIMADPQVGHSSLSQCPLCSCSVNSVRTSPPAFLNS
jgi:hypothetical protein